MEWDVQQMVLTHLDRWGGTEQEMPSVEMERVALPLENMQASISTGRDGLVLEITQPSLTGELTRSF